MADDGPQERPPFNDPKDPRWYSDSTRASSGYPGGSPPSPGGDPVQGPPTGGPPYGTPAQGSPPGSMGDGGGQYGSGQYSGDYGSGPDGGGDYGSYQAPGQKGLSIAALALGIAAIFTGGFLVIPQILAVVFGHLALKREPSGKALALTGLIIGYVMVALTVLVVVSFVALIAFSTSTSG
ncbi:DUF4190 domain-containing protein [Arthrobacter sp. Br18]|uniref:DUF4190 domain-containing protein n=1 Tax=Arthrobacter sp. Br18 TaxID=1312954 RepID=UPI0004AFAB95|nr:DUF4190 domain-containing protein [Arthrobacter sp. Br18]